MKGCLLLHLSIFLSALNVVQLYSAKAKLCHITLVLPKSFIRQPVVFTSSFGLYTSLCISTCLPGCLHTAVSSHLRALQLHEFGTVQGHNFRLVRQQRRHHLHLRAASAQLRDFSARHVMGDSPHQLDEAVDTAVGCFRPTTLSSVCCYKDLESFSRQFRLVN